jgi:hypothetical protein
MLESVYLLFTAKYDWNHIIVTTLINWDTQCEGQQCEMSFKDLSLTCLCKIKSQKCIYNIRTLSVNIKFICTSFRNRQNSEPSSSFSGLFRSEYKWILHLSTMYVCCVYPAMSKKSENLLDLDKKDRNKRYSSPS